MKNNNTLWLQIDTYDENNKCKIIEFEVLEEWLIKQLDSELLEDFLEEYTSDKSMMLYEKAILENQIINEQISQ